VLERGRRARSATPTSSEWSWRGWRRCCRWCQVIAEMTPRHRAEEFRRFLTWSRARCPTTSDVHVVLDNSSTHKTPSSQHWLTSSSAGSPSWPRSGDQAQRPPLGPRLGASIRTWIANWSDEPPCPGFSPPSKCLRCMHATLRPV